MAITIISSSALQPPFDIGKQGDVQVFSCNYRFQIKALDIPNLLDSISDLITSESAIEEDSIFLGGSSQTIPSTEGPFILLVPTGGFNSSKAHKGIVISRPTVQVLTYSTDYSIAKSSAEIVYQVLDQRYGINTP